MKATGMTPKRFAIAGALLTLIACYAAAPRLSGQNTEGFNAVWSNKCYSSLTQCGSSAFIDVTPFFSAASPANDICGPINSALQSAFGSPNNFPATVIDARGLIVPSPYMNFVCTSNPFNGISQPSTVLLPPNTIAASATLEPYAPETKIIGMGVGSTTIMSSASPAIQICSSCTGSGIQDLSIQNSPSHTLTGIEQQAGALSYVQRVTISTGGVGLQIDSTATNSGPYSDITVSSTGAACATILPSSGVGATGLRIRGLNCLGGNSGAAVYLDGSGDSMQDVYIGSGYSSGIQVGDSASVNNDALINVTSAACGGTVVLSNANLPVEDVSLLGIANTGGSGCYSINDEVTTTSLSDSQVEMYILGESVSVGSTTGYARFSTSPNTVTWGAGTSDPTSGTCTSSVYGALYSKTSGAGGCSATGPYTNCILWVCSYAKGGWYGVY